MEFLSSENGSFIEYKIKKRFEVLDIPAFKQNCAGVRDLFLLLKIFKKIIKLKRNTQKIIEYIYNSIIVYNYSKIQMCVNRHCLSN
jgi:hypothetical protein